MDNQTPKATHLTHAQRIDWLRMIRSDNVGPRVAKFIGLEPRLPEA